MTDHIDGVVDRWLRDPDLAERIANVSTEPARTALYEALDPPVPPRVAEALARRGVDQLYRHQVDAITATRAGVSTVIAAGTASGKSLAFQVPILETILADADARALLVYPTKALAQDQLRAMSSFGIDEVVAAIYDGDTPPEERRWVRRHANVVLTNPDMLHVGILPHHGSWARFLAGLRIVVVDELHTLRGIFGSHAALILRRLRRLAAHHGAHPTFVFASATIGNPGELASALSGIPAKTVDRDTSPTGRTTFVLWNPELEDVETGRRASPLGEATRVFAELVSHDLHTIVFSRSRKASELIYRWSRDRLDADRAHRIAPYRGGYLAADRRRTEERLFSGDLLGVAATNALELGIDVGGLDAAVITTFPGTIASFRQQAGRAGRALDDSLAVLVAGADALDQYYMRHPGDLYSRSAEAAVVNPTNPEILRAHLGCAAFELPLVPDDRDYLGEEMEELVGSLVADGSLLVRDGKLFWRGGRSPAHQIDIRTSGGPPYAIVDEGGRIIGTVDESRAFSQCHPGAVYLHAGDGYVVDRLDLELREVRVTKAEVGYYTQPKVDTDVGITRVAARRPVGRISAGHGTVVVETIVQAYRRKSISSGEILETIPIDLPSQRFATQAVWFTIPETVIASAGIGAERLPGVLHAIEHTAIAMLPLYAICDRWDVGGLSIPYHPDLAGPGFYIYDGYPGGAGIAPIAFDVAERHLRATADALRDCPCSDGCPSCVQSPKCGNFNEPLDKQGALTLLEVALATEGVAAAR